MENKHKMTSVDVINELARIEMKPEDLLNIIHPDMVNILCDMVIEEMTMRDLHEALTDRNIDGDDPDELYEAFEEYVINKNNR